MRSPGPWFLLTLVLFPVTLSAQTWRSGEEWPLVVAAVEARSARDQDRALAGWRATATGLVRFASVIEHGSGPIERVIRADELRVEVYGEAPNRSKQRILAWRDTTFLPNRISYHRDHLGIVANDFGGTIRLGDGDEVRDVPHPLSRAGLRYYQFAAGDTITVARSEGAIRVVAFEVRPARPTDPGAVGTLFLDQARAALVSFRFTFTPPAYRDATVADITVVLENALVDGRQWLPWRQAITIRRESPWLALPLSSVLRADWTIDDYLLGLPPSGERFLGAAIDGLRRPGGPDDWVGPLAKRLTELPATTTDRDAVEQLAREHLGGGGSLRGLPSLRLGANGVSDLLHLTRVQGVVPGVGAELASGRWAAAGHLGLGTSDGRVVGRFTADREVGALRLGVAARREMHDIGDWPVVSRVQNSLRTLLDGSDRGDWTLVEEVMASATGRSGATRFSVQAGWQTGRSVASSFTALDGTRQENPALGAPGQATLRGTVLRWVAGGNWLVKGEWGLGDSGWARLAAQGTGEGGLGPGRLEWVVHAGLGSRRLPPYRGFVLGGQGSLPGVGFRAIGGRRSADATLAWLVPVPLPSPPIRALDGVALPSRIGPFLGAGVAGGELGETRWRGGGVIHPVLGLRTELWGPLLRVDLGVALRTGEVGLTVDLHPLWWPIL